MLKKIFTVLFVGAVSSSAIAEHTLLQSITMSPKEKLECNLSALVDFKAASITIVRLDTRGKKYDINQFQKHPQIFKDFSFHYPLKTLFPRIHLEDVNNVEAQFDLSGSQRQMKVKVTDHAGAQLTAVQDISGFFSAAASSCLLRPKR